MPSSKSAGIKKSSGKGEACMTGQRRRPREAGARGPCIRICNSELTESRSSEAYFTISQRTKDFTAGSLDRQERNCRWGFRLVSSRNEIALMAWSASRFCTSPVRARKLPALHLLMSSSFLLDGLVLYCRFGYFIERLSQFSRFIRESRSSQKCSHTWH